MTVIATQSAAEPAELAADLFAGGARAALARAGAFALLYALLIVVGYLLKENSSALTIMWPGAGLLLFALWRLPARQWIWIFALQLPVEVALGYVFSANFSLRWAVFFACANFLDAVVGATLAKWLVRSPSEPRAQQVVRFFVLAASGAAASAALGGWGAAHLLPDSSYLRQAQLWWAGNTLGSMVVVPVLLVWTIRWQLPQQSAGVSPKLELTLIIAVALGLTYWIFATPPAHTLTMAQLPAVLTVVLCFAAFRLPPRWSVTLAGMWP